jgi:mannose-6-phosphate isomerase-like protein (cupin superfamily)
MVNQHNREDHVTIDRRTALEQVVRAAVAGALFGGAGTNLAAAGQQPRTSGPNILGSGGVRRIITANDAQGKSFIVSDQRITTGEFPSLFKTMGDNPLGPGAPGEMKEFLPTDAPQIEPSLGGSSFHYVTLPPWKPDMKPFWHRTLTVDYNILLAGELVLMVNSGEVTLRPGDVVVQRNTSHAWRNNSMTEPVHWVAVLVPIRRQA